MFYQLIDNLGYRDNNIVLIRPQIDAILLGSKRIGHGYALAKHPKLLELLKKHDIAVEVNPVSNQVIQSHSCYLFCVKEMFHVDHIFRY